MLQPFFPNYRLSSINLQGFFPSFKLSSEASAFLPNLPNFRNIFPSPPQTLHRCISIECIIYNASVTIRSLQSVLRLVSDIWHIRLQWIASLFWKLRKKVVWPFEFSIQEGTYTFVLESHHLKGHPTFERWKTYGGGRNPRTALIKTLLHCSRVDESMAIESTSRRQSSRRVEVIESTSRSNRVDE